MKINVSPYSGKKVTEISSGFLANKNIDELYLPLNLKTIADNAFKNCTGITGRLVIPSSVTAIGKSEKKELFADALLTARAGQDVILMGYVGLEGMLRIVGEKESALSSLADATVKLPAHTPFEVQELTLPVYHALCAALESNLFWGEKGSGSLEDVGLNLMLSGA